MVEMIKMGRKWEINTIEDYNKALEVLEGNKFCAWMSEGGQDFWVEMREYDRQMADVKAQAQAKGII